MTRVFIFAGLLAIFSGAVVMADTQWTAQGFDMPESALFDAGNDRIILSVIGGNPGAADGHGGLALLSPDGQVIDAQWVTGLDAPKGMAVIGGNLLVADLTRVHEIDLTTGDILRSVDHPEAVFLNDVSSDGQVAFVSDLMTDSIWRYANGALTLWMQDARLSHPNGLLLDGDHLLVGSWGAGLRADFTTEVQGSLLSVDLESQDIRVLAGELGNLDGIARIGGTVFVNDWVTGALFALDATGALHEAGRFAPGLADISTDGERLFLPMMLDGALSAISVP